MKKTLLFAVLLHMAALAGAQGTTFSIERFDNQIPGPISIFAGEQLLGLTNESGTLKLPSKIWFVDIGLEQNGQKLWFETKDTSSVLGNGEKVYAILIVPNRIEEVLIQATRAGENDPYAQNTVSQQALVVQNTGRDLPIMLQFQPSVITTSDAGNGVGYTGIRVRGSDASRTNITVNGVPINDAESQGTFWVNMPDFASSVQSVQMQYGVGSSTNGAGAFGATVNMQTSTSFKPYGYLSNSFGSYRTLKSTFAGGTGIINGHWTADFRLSRIKSDGYVDRATSDLSSYFMSLGYFEKKWSVKLLHFAGSEHTYQAWNGIPKEKMYGPDSALQNHYYRNAGEGYTYKNSGDSLNLFQSGQRTYNYYTYENETDNYKQGHYHLYFNYAFNARNKVNITLYRTNGQGYFEQFRFQDKLENYNLPNVVFGSDTFTKSDIIRRRWLGNTLTGINANYTFSARDFLLIAGGGYNQYLGDHFGEIVWARLAPSASHLGRYYNSTGDKYDGNIFVKANYAFQGKYFLFADLQVRRVYHEGRGFDNDLRPVYFRGDFLFFNPKAGITADFKKAGKFFASVAVGNKEPSRSDFTDAASNARPVAESMVDGEMGWSLQRKKWQTRVNLYYMNYKNQLVMTGAVNDVGTPLRTNVAASYRTGVEFNGTYKLVSKWHIFGNFTASRNRIASITLKTFDYMDGSVKEVTKTDVPISYSPDLIAAIGLDYTPAKGWNLIWNTKYVGRQFLDNSGDENKTLDAYSFSEIWVNKHWDFKHSYLDAKLQLLNVFNALYNNNGYTFEYYYGPQLTREVFLFPSAPRNSMVALVLGF